MNKETSESYRIRKEYFNAHADQWLDMWYKDTVTGLHDKHEKDFQRLFSLLPIRAGDRILDAGCGSGVLVPFLLERITASGLLYEVDFAEKMIEVNRRMHPQENIRYLLSDAENIPLEEGSCDAVICFSSFPHFQDQERALASLARILKNQGIFNLSHFHSSEGIQKHHEPCPAVMHDRLPEEATMRTWLQKAGLTVEKFIDEPGFYCVIARKTS